MRNRAAGPSAHSVRSGQHFLVGNVGAAERMSLSRPLDEGNHDARPAALKLAFAVGQPSLFLTVRALNLLLATSRRMSIRVGLKPDHCKRFEFLRVARALAGGVVANSGGQIGRNTAVIGAVSAKQEITAPTGGNPGALS